MRVIYRNEVERHMASLTKAEAEALSAVLAKVTDSTCDVADAERAAATVAV
jgi:hypothetical protein